VTSFEVERKDNAEEILNSFMNLIDESFLDIPIETTKVLLPYENKDYPYYNFSKANNFDSLKNEEKCKELLKELSDKKVSSISIESKKDYRYSANNSHPDLTFTFKFESRPSHDLDLITLSYNVSSQPLMPSARNYIYKFIEILPKYFTKKTVKTTIDSFLSEAQKKEIDIYKTEISDLGKVSKAIIETISTQTKEWNQALLDTQKKLNEQYQLDKEKLQIEFAERDEKLKQQVQEFEDRKKQFDDRERTVVRRELLTKIEKIIEQQSKFNLSETTIGKRSIVNKICYSVLGFSGLGITSIAATFIFNYFAKNILDWNLLIPSGAFAVIFGSTLIFYLRWSSQWYREHADIEFSNQVFSRDMLRASWIVEMFFEWKEQKEFDMPVEIYNAISKNLFNERISSKQINHPIEDLLKITGKFSKVKLGKEGIEVENAGKEKG
jgi:hypothetical protein